MNRLLYKYCPFRKAIFRDHLIGLQKICFQKINNENWALIGRSVSSTSIMVILIFRKICFQPRSPGGLFFYFLVVCFIRSSCGVLHRVFHISSQHWYLHLSRDTHENTRARTHSSVPRKKSNPPPDQQIAARGTGNQHLGQLCAGETGTSLFPPRGQATADDGRNRSTAGGCDVFAAGQARAAAYQAAAGAGSGDAGDKDEEGSYSDSSGDVPVERTETLELSPATAAQPELFGSSR